ncbi:hypothetical protein [Streptomyces sp. ODS28]|uniref:hypothetical protein n=1 Tax=Streptomyces sp. ODS28 TaxID=3136688 RepID=UPI0031E696AB
MEQSHIPFPEVRRGTEGRLYVPAGYVTDTLRSLARYWTESEEGTGSGPYDADTVQALAQALEAHADALDVHLITIATGPGSKDGDSGEERVTAAVAEPAYDTSELGVEAHSILGTAEHLFASLTGSGTPGAEKELTGALMRAALGALAGESLTRYPAALKAFAVRRRGRLEQFYGNYGPRSSLAGRPRYRLVRHPVSLIVCERLQNARTALQQSWPEGLPYELLEGAAEAWGVRLQETKP